ncbi:MAG: hypothetical protein WAS75_14695 [Candidatus Microthrix subdominans]
MTDADLAAERRPGKVGRAVAWPIIQLRRLFVVVGDWWTSSLEPKPVASETLDELRSNAMRRLERNSGQTHDRVPPDGEFFELYKLMVDSSERLVARRQGVNTFFLSINGFIMTVMGLLVQAEGKIQLQAGGVAIVAVVGLVLCQAWRSLLISFGQLNTGKFVVIDRMEDQLAASIYAAEWEALGKGKNDRVYRSFTKREADVPVFLGAVYSLAVVLGLVIWVGWWTP